MNIMLAARRDITFEVARRVGWGRESVAIGPAAEAVMASAREAFLSLIADGDTVVYGVTSGYGFRAKDRLDDEERLRHARRPPFAAATSFGRPLPERVVRTIVLARLANFLEGHAAITPALAIAVAGLLQASSLPAVPVKGNGGSGEIQTLSHLFGPLAAAVDLGPKDALSLINGSPAAAGLVTDAALAALARLDLAEAVFAAAAEAFLMPLEHIDPVLDEFWGDAAEAATLQRLRILMAGGVEVRRPYQAPVSFRIMPRMLARLRRAAAAARTAAETSLCAVTDNPVFVPPDSEHPRGRILSTGGFHNAMATPAMDELAAAYADLVTLTERYGAKLLTGDISRLPDQLLVEGDDGNFLGCLPMAGVGLSEAARHAAQRTFLPASESGGFAQNDVATTNFPAWERLEEAGHCLDGALASLSLIVERAFSVTGRQAPEALRPLLREIRDVGLPQDGPSGLALASERLLAHYRQRIYAPAAPD